MEMKTKNRICVLFGRNIKAWRNEKALSQEQLSELSGLDRTYVGGVERGERNISLLNIVKFAKALNVSVQDLFDSDIDWRDLI